MNLTLLRKLLPLLGLVVLALVVIGLLLFGSGDRMTPLPEFKPAKPILEEMPFGPTPEPTPTPTPRYTPEPGPPLPREYKIAAGVLAALALVAFIYGCFRAWRSSNLFDRTYGFPRVQDVPVRFGGKKTGGLMAVVSFGPGDPAPAPRVSKPEDA